MIRLSMVLWVAAIALAAVFLYEVKHRVQDLEEQLAEVHGDILRDQEAIQVLKAEWSYLNRPARIAELADRYLELKPIEASQIASFREVPQAPETAPQQEPTPRTQEASLPQQAETAPRQKDSIGNLIEAVAVEESNQPAATSTQAPTQIPTPAPRQDTAKARKPQGPVNPVTGEPLPVSAQSESAGQPIQLIRTGAQQ